MPHAEQREKVPLQHPAPAPLPPPAPLLTSIMRASSFILLFFLFPSHAASTTSGRKTLPFFPLISEPLQAAQAPSPSFSRDPQPVLPSPTPSPKDSPATTTTSSSSSSVVPTIPVNTSSFPTILTNSSLTFSRQKFVSSKPYIILTLVFLGFLVLLVVFFLHCRRRVPDDQASRSDGPTATASVDRQRISASSAPPAAAASPARRMGSLDLLPLPPLSGQVRSESGCSSEEEGYYSAGESE